MTHLALKTAAPGLPVKRDLSVVVGSGQVLVSDTCSHPPARCYCGVLCPTCPSVTEPHTYPAPASHCYCCVSGATDTHRSQRTATPRERLPIGAGQEHGQQARARAKDPASDGPLVEPEPTAVQGRNVQSTKPLTAPDALPVCALSIPHLSPLHFVPVRLTCTCSVPAPLVSRCSIQRGDQKQVGCACCPGSALCRELAVPPPKLNSSQHSYISRALLPSFMYIP